MTRSDDGAPAGDPVARAYAGLAAGYDRRWAGYIAASLEATLSRLSLPVEGRLLDVGCGTGALLLEVAGRWPDARLAGLDLTSEMLAVAERRLGGAAELHQGRAEALPFAPESFDVVVSSSVLHFLQQPEAAVRDMARVLKPGGRLVLTDWCADFRTIRLLDRLLRLIDRAHHRTLGTAQCRELLAAAGLVGIEIAAYKIDRLWGLMTATGTKPGSERRPPAGGGCGSTRNISEYDTITD